MHHSPDQSLESAYQALKAARARQVTTPSTIPVDAIHALASGAPVDGDREALLDRVLADPNTAREFAFFVDALRMPSTSQRRWFRSPGTLALAAGLLLAAGFGLRMATAPQGERDVLRADGAEVQLVLPASDTVRDTTVTFAWRSVPGTATYSVEVVSEDGTSLLSATTADTNVIAPIPAGDVRWWVIATQDDGTTRRSPVRLLVVR